MRRRFELFISLPTIILLALLSIPVVAKYQFSEKDYFFSEMPRNFENMSCTHARSKNLGEFKIRWDACFPRGSTEEERRKKYFDTLKITITNKQKDSWRQKVFFSRFGCYGCFSHWASDVSLIKFEGDQNPVLLFAESTPAGSSGGSVHHIALFNLIGSPKNIGELAFEGYETYWDPEIPYLIPPEYLKDTDQDGALDILTSEYNCSNRSTCREGGWIYSFSNGEMRRVKKWYK
jgi:hypothetical protein